MHEKPSKYTSEWFGFLAEGSRRWAQEILPLTLASFPVASALDVGCATGEWLAVLRDLGVDDVVGVDGDYVDRALLQFPAERFVPLDLAKRFDLGRTFDLVISMEVAEHLPPEAADGFVASLVRHAPVVLFSAAIPGQSGVDHVNEQWQSYWAEKFGSHDFHPIDLIRSQVWSTTTAEWWYGQNTNLYARETAIPESMRERVVENLASLSIVHPRQYEWAARRKTRRRLLLEGTIGPEMTERLRRLVGRGG